VLGVVFGVSPKQIHPQTDLQTTEYLNVMNGLGQAPWELSFSLGPPRKLPCSKLGRVIR
jgi:hypothetical protein